MVRRRGGCACGRGAQGELQARGGGERREGRPGRHAICCHHTVLIIQPYKLISNAHYSRFLLHACRERDMPVRVRTPTHTTRPDYSGQPGEQDAASERGGVAADSEKLL